MTNSANLPAPYGGQNTLTPTAVLMSPFAETLFNFNTTEAGISLRNGDSKWAAKAVNTTGGVTVENFQGFVQYGQTSLFMAMKCTGGGIQQRYYDISTAGAAPTLAYTSISGIIGPIYTTYFAGRVFIYGSNSATAVGDYYDGSSWGSWGYTMPAASLPIGGCVYKNRQYFIFSGGPTYGYSEIDAVTGDVTLVNLGGVISENANLAIITPITISNEVSSTVLLCFVFFSGEVLFYSGRYPNSAEWGLVGRANISRPLNYNSALSPYQGDSLIATSTGLISLRDLFLRGSENAADLSISKAITPDWVDLITVALAATGGPNSIVFIRMSWWKKQNRIVISIPNTINGPSHSGMTFFVYDTLRRAWAVHDTVGNIPIGISTSAPVDLINFQQNLLFCASPGAFTSGGTTYYCMIKSKEGATDFQDVNVDNSTKTSYDFTMLDAPIPFPKTAVYEAAQIEPILESDLYAETNWNFVVDFGRQTSGNQKTDAATTSVAKPAVNVGMQNITFVQVKMSGTTAASKTVGLDLYSYNVWYNSGDLASR